METVSSGSRRTCSPIYGPKAEFLLKPASSKASCDVQKNMQPHIGYKGWFPVCNCFFYALLWYTENMQPARGQKAECLRGVSSRSSCCKPRKCITMCEPKAEFLRGAVPPVTSCVEIKTWRQCANQRLNFWWELPLLCCLGVKKRKCSPLLGLNAEFLMGLTLLYPFLKNKEFLMGANPLLVSEEMEPHITPKAEFLIKCASSRSTLLCQTHVGTKGWIPHERCLFCILLCRIKII